jgi:N6-L-threonylcarbamoyladenine synthase
MSKEYDVFTLGVESSCDETSAAVVCDGKVLSCTTVSSLRRHARYGGVIPEIATRMHARTIDTVVQAALNESGVAVDDIGLVAVTRGPGLIGSLLVGICFAKAFAYARRLPFIGVDHLHAHIFAALLNRREPISFPFIGLVVSGGHTQLFLARDFTDLEIIGRTTDDAAGESMDKVGRFYGLEYPAGPHIDRLFDLQYVDPHLFAMRVPGKYDFSFSGIKTKAVYMLRQNEAAGLSELDRRKVLSSFQYAIVEEVIKKLTKAVEEFKISRVVCGGGVVANSYLRSRLDEAASEFSLDMVTAERAYCGDNAAMVAGLGEYLFRKGVTTPFNAAPFVR